MLVRLTLGYLRDRLRAGSFMTAAVPPVSNPDIAYLADAHASDEGVGIGGWERVEGRPLKECRWFSLQLTKRTAPWAFAAGEPFRTIASLEPLASLIGLMAFRPEPLAGADPTITLAGATDNRGNSYVVGRMLTTKFPSSAS